MVMGASLIPWLRRGRARLEDESLTAQFVEAATEEARRAEIRNAHYTHLKKPAKDYTTKPQDDYPN